ncbi:Nuclear fusion protein [Yarrowia sp. C11]|nr:Nuclear fusion protein [Yarrowia sp. E02]KAG5372453.1 Nuclear fusion protein [Yarrowia sp. C11]
MNTIKVGDQVTLPEGQQGMVRFVGRVDNKPGEFAGIELLKGWESHGRHSGVYGGVSYFRTETPNTGLFISYPKLVALNNHRGGTTNTVPSQPGSPIFATPKGRPSHITTPRTMPMRHSMIPSSPVSDRGAPFESPSKRRVSGVVKSRVSSVNSTGTVNTSMGGTMPGFSDSSPPSHELRELRDEVESLKVAIRDRDGIIEEAESSLNQFSELVSRNEQLVSELEMKDRKISDLQNDVSSKRREFRDTIDALESEYMHSSQEYQKEVEQLRANLGHAETVDATIVEMESMVASLESGLRISKVNEQEAKERLGLMADIENRLLEKEQELTAVKERLEITKSQLGNGEGDSQLKEELETVKKELENTKKELAESKEALEAAVDEAAPQKTTSRDMGDSEELEKVKKELADTKNQLEELQLADSNTDMTSELADLKKELVQTQEMSLNEQDQSMKMIDTLRKQISEMKQQLKDKNVQLGEHHVGGSSPSKEPQADKSLAIANKKIANLEKEKMYLSEEANEIRYQMSELKQKFYGLEEELREAKEAASNNKNDDTNEKDASSGARNGSVHLVDSEKHIKLAQDYDKLFEDHSKLTDKHEDLSLELEDLKLQLEESKLNAKDTEDAGEPAPNSSAEAEVKMLSSQVSELKENLDKVSSANSKLTQEVEKLESELETKILKEYELEKELEDAKRASTLANGPAHVGGGDGGRSPSTPSNGGDPAAGRELWCGLCERPGHESISCPFENEEF